MTPRTARAIATATCHRLTAESIFFRSTKSAMAPAGNVKREEGSAESVAMSGRSSVESDLAREFRTQNAAVPWAAIALPEIRFASQNLLKAGLRKAVQVEIFAIWGDLRIEPRVKIVNPLASSGAGEFVDFPGIQTSVEMAVPGGQLVGSHLPDVAKA